MKKDELRSLRNKFLENKRLEELRAAEELVRKKEQERMQQLEQRLREWPSLIEEKLKEAAAKGEYQYVFDTGELPEPEVMQIIITQFSELNPRVVRVERQSIRNYDLGTYDTYYVSAIRFSW